LGKKKEKKRGGSGKKKGWASKPTGGVSAWKKRLKGEKKRFLWGKTNFRTRAIKRERPKEQQLKNKNRDGKVHFEKTK